MNNTSFNKKLKNEDKLHPVNIPSVIKINAKHTKKNIIPVEKNVSQSKLFDEGVRKKRTNKGYDNLQKFRRYKTKFEPELYKDIQEEPDENLKDILKEVSKNLKQHSMKKIIDDTLRENKDFDRSEITNHNQIVENHISFRPRNVEKEKDDTFNRILGDVIEEAIEVRKKKDNDAKTKSATNIQTAFKAHKARKDVEHAKEEVVKNAIQNNSATNIQKVFKGHIARKEAREKLINAVNTASADIQRAFRGHKGRKEARVVRGVAYQMTGPDTDTQFASAKYLSSRARGAVVKNNYNKNLEKYSKLGANTKIVTGFAPHPNYPNSDIILVGGTPKKGRPAKTK